MTEQSGYYRVTDMNKGYHQTVVDRVNMEVSLSTPQKLSQVAIEMKELHCVIDRFEVLTDLMNEKLKPVMRPEPDGVEGSNAINPPIAPLAVEIRSVRVRLSEIIDYYTQLANRVEA